MNRDNLIEALVTALAELRKPVINFALQKKEPLNDEQIEEALNMTNWINPSEKPDNQRPALIAVQYESGIDTHIASWVKMFTEQDYAGEMLESELDFNEDDGEYYLPRGWYQQANPDAENCGYFVDSEILAWAELPIFEGFK